MTKGACNFFATGLNKFHLYLLVMALPFFYTQNLQQDFIQLDEDTSKHVIQVLRMEIGERLLLTDGKGSKGEAEIIDDNRKRCVVKIVSIDKEEGKERKVAIAISLTKNASRFEWFLEKATEIGVSEIIPLLCERTEKEKFRFDRMQGILISAMLQSQQSRMPVLHQPTEFNQLVHSSQFHQKFIAHCEETQKQQLTHQRINESANQLIAIGPEGDFTSKEIEAAIGKGFIPVALGDTRLRTETAGIVAATLLIQAK
jgi:16S rRNA (uracil1498-N3)-methyltransferase